MWKKENSRTTFFRPPRLFPICSLRGQCVVESSSLHAPQLLEQLHTMANAVAVLPRSPVRWAPLRRLSSSSTSSLARRHRFPQRPECGCCGTLPSERDRRPSLSVHSRRESDVVVGVTVQQLAQQLATLDADVRAALAFSQAATAAPVVHPARPLVARPRRAAVAVAAGAAAGAAAAGAVDGADDEGGGARKRSSLWRRLPQPRTVRRPSRCGIVVRRLSWPLLSPMLLSWTARRQSSARFLLPRTPRRCRGGRCPRPLRCAATRCERSRRHGRHLG